MWKRQFCFFLTISPKLGIIELIAQSRKEHRHAKIFTAAELKENYQILLRLLGQLQTENDYLQAAMDNLSKIPNNAIPGDIANQAKAIAISELSKNREKTNQKLLETYQKLYEDLRPFLFQENEV